MDELDHNLLLAWNRVFERCRSDPREARRRYDRVASGRTLDRPNRAWCVAVRASDTRLVAAGAVDDRSAARAQVPHKIVLTAEVLRELGGPVELPYPGVPIDVAADRLGKHRESMRKWLPVRPGRTRAARRRTAAMDGLDDQLAWQEHVDPAYPLGVRFEPPGVRGRRGMATPVVWSDVPLDPAGQRGRPPNAWWGSAWRLLAWRIPASFEQSVQREPRYLTFRGGDRFRGWLWRCPGLGSAEAGCERLVANLYAPLPAWTVGRALGIEDGLAVEGLSGQWLPGVMDRWAGRRSLACAFCWKLRWSSFADDTGWNDLVSHLSGGLLYGREVEKPAGFEHERKRAYRPRRRAQAKALAAAAIGSRVSRVEDF